MVNDQYFDSILNGEHLVSADYDEAIVALNRKGDFDLLPAICYELSERCETPEHYARAKLFVSELSEMCLLFNMHESDNPHNEALLEADENGELPDLDITNRSIPF